jgi:hypothetical protein
LVKGISAVETIASTAMALAMISAFLLGFAGFRMLIGKADRTRGLLMLGAAAVLIANVLIWTL